MNTVWYISVILSNFQGGFVIFDNDMLHENDEYYHYVNTSAKKRSKMIIKTNFIKHIFHPLLVNCVFLIISWCQFITWSSNSSYKKFKLTIEYQKWSEKHRDTMFWVDLSHMQKYFCVLFDHFVSSSYMCNAPLSRRIKIRFLLWITNTKYHSEDNG